MKNYSKTFLIIFCFTLVAGMSHAQIKYGVKAGATGSNLAGFEKFFNFVTDGEKINTEMTIRYHAGLSLDASVGKLFVRPELEFIQQGFAAKYQYESTDAEPENFQMYYLKLPVNIGYKHELNMDTDLRFGIGGYAAYYLGGNEALKGYDIKPLDFGISVIAALDYINTSTSISYEHGLVDVVGMDNWSTYRKANNLSALRNSCLKISFAYYF